MKFKTTKFTTTCTLIAALAAYLAAAWFQKTAPDSTTPIALALIGTALFIISLAARFLWAKCPHCGARIDRKHMSNANCPFCGKELNSH